VKDCLTSHEIHKEAQLARLSGLCYYSEWETLKTEARREGFEVIAGADTYFTRWYLAKGRLDGGVHRSSNEVTFEALAQTAVRRLTDSPPRRGVSRRRRWCACSSVA